MQQNLQCSYALADIAYRRTAAYLLFTSRSFFQSNECKRFLNNEDVDLVVQRPPDREQVAGLLIVAGAGVAEEPIGRTEEELPQSDAEFGAQDEDGGASEASEAHEEDAAAEPGGVASDPPSMDEHGQPARKRAKAEGQKKRTTQTTSCLQASASFARLPASSTTGCIVALL